jgi:hypothetical protein
MVTPETWTPDPWADRWSLSALATVRVLDLRTGHTWTVQASRAWVELIQWSETGYGLAVWIDE